MFVLCIVLTTFKEQVDRLNLFELANQFYYENEHYFYIFGKFNIRDFRRKFIENAAVGTQLSNQRCRSAKNQTWYFSIYRTNWNFLMKFCSSDPSFNRNVLTYLYLEFKIFAHAPIAVSHYFVLFTNFLTGYGIETCIGDRI